MSPLFYCETGLASCRLILPAVEYTLATGHILRGVCPHFCNIKPLFCFHPVCSFLNTLFDSHVTPRRNKLRPRYSTQCNNTSACRYLDNCRGNLQPCLRQCASHFHRSMSRTSCDEHLVLGIDAVPIVQTRSDVTASGETSGDDGFVTHHQRHTHRYIRLHLDLLARSADRHGKLCAVLQVLALLGFGETSVRREQSVIHALLVQVLPEIELLGRALLPRSGHFECPFTQVWGQVIEVLLNLPILTAHFLTSYLLLLSRPKAGWFSLPFHAMPFSYKALYPTW